MEELQFLDNVARIHASAEDGGFAVIESLAPAGSQPPLHVHRDEGEAFCVLEGELTLWVGEDRRTLRAGEFLVAPPEVPHTIRVGEGGARWLVIAGGRFESFVRSPRSTASRTRPSSGASPRATASTCSARQGCCRASSRPSARGRGRRPARRGP